MTGVYSHNEIGLARRGAPLGIQQGDAGFVTHLRGSNGKSFIERVNGSQVAVIVQDQRRNAVVIALIKRLCKVCRNDLKVIGVASGLVIGEVGGIARGISRKACTHIIEIVTANLRLIRTDESKKGRAIGDCRRFKSKHFSRRGAHREDGRIKGPQLAREANNYILLIPKTNYLVIDVHVFNL